MLEVAVSLLASALGAGQAMEARPSPNP